MRAALSWRANPTSRAPCIWWTFQNIALFKGMSVLDNVISGTNLSSRASWAEQALTLGRAPGEEDRQREQAEEILDFLEIQPWRQAIVGELPYGLQKRVELARALAAQPRHAREALALGQLQAVDNHPELAWRLARREAYDSLGVLVQATARAWKEPRAVRPPLAPLERMQVHCYQLLAQLTAVKSMLLLRRGHLRAEDVQEPLQAATARLEAVLTGAAVATAPASDQAGVYEPQALPPLVETDLAPWLLRRLCLAEELARQLRSEAMAVVVPLRAD